MRPTILATAATLLSVTSARIIGFAVPSTVAPDDDVKVQILTENYNQAVQDVAFSFGLSPEKTAFLGVLGTTISHKSLGPDFSNSLENITHYVHIPAKTYNGSFVLQGAHFSLTGTSSTPSTSIYYANITVTNTTSSTYVTSELIPQIS